MHRTARRTYLVKQVAQLTGISVRTLHHYDQIGLLVPTQRSGAGYRLYDDRDLLRLQQIMIQRELGLPLEEIRRCLDDPAFDRRQALLTQRELLLARAADTTRMLHAVEQALALLAQPPEEDTMDRKELFAGFDPARHEAEAEQRWGHSDAFEESRRRTQSYGPEDWRRLGEEHAALYADALALLQAGEPPDGERARALAERHRLSIDRWFYPCSKQLHQGLAELYESDARFAANIDRHGAGLTTFLVAAIRANASQPPA